MTVDASSMAVLRATLRRREAAEAEARAARCERAWGIPSEDYFLAVTHLLGVSAEFSLDLVAMERCPEHLLRAINERGMAL